MLSNNILQIVIYFIILFACIKPVGSYMAYIYQDNRIKFLNPIDNGIWNREDQRAIKNDYYKGSSIPDNMIGYIYLNFKSFWPASMRSCFATPCSSSDNVLTATLNY